MAYLLPLPYDMQFKIESMVTSMKLREVMHELNEVCEEFRCQVKQHAEENYHSYWMWSPNEREALSQEQIDDWEAMSYDEMDHDLYISKWGEGYRFEMCISAVLTNDPEEASFKSLPLP